MNARISLPAKKTASRRGGSFFPAVFPRRIPSFSPKKTGGRPYVNARLWIQVFFRYIPA